MSAREQDGNGWAYRPHLDGLRAVAVYLVVVFHSGIDRLSGGFIGVDIFFVLSGYLVTGILLRDLEGSGRIQFARFYARRARRLLPAAAVTLVVTALVFGAIGSMAEVIDARAAIRAAALYVANWHFISQSADYFAADLESSPVLHFWSLAVEEQFYLLWPLVFWALHSVSGRVGGRSRTVLRVLVGALALASVGAALRISGDDLERAYYGTDTRAYQLLAGALLALSPGLIARARRLRIGSIEMAAVWPWFSMVLLGGLAVLATSILSVDPIERGIATTVLVVALLISLEAVGGGIGRRLLSTSPLVYLGKISYGTYLWHWLVIVVLSHEADISSRATLAVTIPVATGLASLSHQVLEMPIREAPVLDRWKTVTLASGLAISLLVGLVVSPGLLDEGKPPGQQVAVAGVSTVRAGTGQIDLQKVGAAWSDTFDYESCPSSTPEACTLVTGSGETALVVGDSHAATYAGMFSEIARRYDLNLYGGLLSYCPWTRGIRYLAAGPDCIADQERMFEEILPEIDPDIVFLAHRPVDDRRDPMPMFDADAGAVDGEERDERLAERVSSLVSDLVEDGRTVVVIEPMPVGPTDFDPIACLQAGEGVEPCRFTSAESGVPEDAVLRELDERFREVVSVDLDRATCPYLPICDPIVNGEVVRRDNNHLTVDYATSLAGVVEEILVAEDVLDPAA